MKTKSILIVSATVAVSAGALIMYSSSRDEAAAPPDASPADTFVAAEIADYTCDLSVGATSSYAWRSSDSARVDTSGLGLTPAGVAPVRNTLESSFTLTTRVLESDDVSAILLGRMTSVTSDAVPSTENLEEPFLLEVSRDCQLTGFGYLTTTPRGYARHQQAFVFDVTWRANARAMTGATTMGEFEASLTTRVDAHADVLETVRTVRAYDLWPHQRKTPIALESSTLSVTHSREGLFDEATLHEHLSGEHVTLTRKVYAERVGVTPDALAGAPTERSLYTWEDLLPQDVSVPGLDPLLAARAEQVRKTRGVPIDTMLEDHITRNAAEEPIQRAWVPLRNWLEGNPEQTGALIERIKLNEMEDRAQMTAFMALGDAQTPEAKKALVGVMDDEIAPVIQRSRSILALINRPDTGVALAESLSAYSVGIESGGDKSERAFARQSILALGAMAGYKTQDEDVRDVAVTTARRALSSVEEPLNRRPVYGAIANIGDPEHLQLVADIPSHQDRNMRKAAARVFRRMHPYSSDAFVLGWLQQETSLQVRRELYDTLELQTYDADVDPSDAILSIARRDLDQKPGIAMRKSLILLLSRSLARRPADPLEIRPVMERIAAHEMVTNSGLYIYAAKQLDSQRLTDIAHANSGGAVGSPIDTQVIVPSTSPGISNTRRTP